MSDVQAAPTDDAVEPWRKRPSTWHLTRWGAVRARKRWLRDSRGRDAYLRRHGRFHWECSRIESARGGWGRDDLRKRAEKAEEVLRGALDRYSERICADPDQRGFSDAVGRFVREVREVLAALSTPTTRGGEAMTDSGLKGVCLDCGWRGQTGLCPKCSGSEVILASGDRSWRERAEKAEEALKWVKLSREHLRIAEQACSSIHADDWDGDTDELWETICAIRAFLSALQKEERCTCVVLEGERHDTTDCPVHGYGTEHWQRTHYGLVPPAPQPEEESTAHSTYVQIVSTGGFFASCTTCGSDPFPNRSTLGEAEQDASEHGNLRHLYPREQLVKHESFTLLEKEA